MIAAGAVMGATFQAGTVIWGTLLQRRVPPALLGRVSSLDFFVSLSFMPLSMALAGPVSEVIGLTDDLPRSPGSRRRCWRSSRSSPPGCRPTRSRTRSTSARPMPERAEARSAGPRLSGPPGAAAWMGPRALDASDGAGTAPAQEGEPWPS